MESVVLKAWTVPNDGRDGAESDFITVEHRIYDEDTSWIEIHVHETDFDLYGWQEYASDIVEATIFAAGQEMRLAEGLPLEVEVPAPAAPDGEGE